MIRMRAPEGLTGFSHQGHAIEVGADGAVLVDPRHRLDLEAHGFSPWDAPAAASTAVSVALGPLDADRARLVALFTETVAAMPDDEVARMIADADQRRRLEQEEAERIDPAQVTVEAIELMKRHELFAFLRKRGIRVVPPVDNETLRANARAALAPAS
ncbi:hypothetical protein QO001_002207 [Methylobacterium brachiatum]|uniref:Uncharacterized protein n=1 Tax=Methylobacterium brachiatum TaxID=269660 RepID=A0AAJ1TM73_9HYPH|nr:hypothetical protein [Methylobacterium brachiatum]MCB4802655.1 hypothetical protein [Methylobacterium brachiatum]MDQ0543281.1 hypothetical protein [Methylobacterium brachiatum]